MRRIFGLFGLGDEFCAHAEVTLERVAGASSGYCRTIRGAGGGVAETGVNGCRLASRSGLHPQRSHQPLGVKQFQIDPGTGHGPSLFVHDVEAGNRVN